MLLDHQATKQNIEDSFMRHLTNNTAIERGDAMLIYFAGHGSRIPSPNDWFQGGIVSGNVEVLCPYDHDTKRPEGRVAGISDRSMHALINQLSSAKGDNITFIVDCCFSPTQSYENILDRRRTRWTPTRKAKPDDLYAGLWSEARGKLYTPGSGFYQIHPTTHVFLAACNSDEKATEGKAGGRFTRAFLEAARELAFHDTSYGHLAEYLSAKMSNNQHPVCLGRRKTRMMFDGIPFVPEVQYVSVHFDMDKRMRIDIGAIQGVVEGTRLSLHTHNCRGSRNPAIGEVLVVSVQPTWCLARLCTADQTVGQARWAQVTHWNNCLPFRVHLKAKITTLFEKWNLFRRITFCADGAPPTSASGVKIIGVTDSKKADISLTIGRHEVTVETHDDLIIAGSPRSVRFQGRIDVDVIDEAARFHLHLHRENPQKPLHNLVSMELYRLDPSSWSKIGGNLLSDGKAQIVNRRGDIFAITIHNRSDLDLWPYLAILDPSSYTITILHEPGSESTTSPLPKQSLLEIGSGKPGSEAISFPTLDHHDTDSGTAFLKLFLSSAPVSMSMIEQGCHPAPAKSLMTNQPSATSTLVPPGADQIWDTDLATITLLR